MKKSIVGAALGAVLIAVGLSGCGEGNTKPTPSPTASVKELNASESPSETPTPEQKPTPPVDVDPPERPAAMDNADEAGAVAAAEYYLRLTVYAAATGDTSELETMSGEECENCKSYISTVKNRHADGEVWTSMPSIHLSESQQWIKSEIPLQYQVEFDAKKDGYEYYASNGQLNTVPEEHVIFAVLPTFDGSWIISAAQSFPQEPMNQSSSNGQ